MRELLRFAKDTLGAPQSPKLLAERPDAVESEKSPAPVSQEEETIVPGELVVGTSRHLEPGALIALLAPARLDLSCEAVAYASETLQLVRCVLRDGRRLSPGETRTLAEGWALPEGVQFIETNGLRKSQLIPSDTLYPRQWHLPAMGLPDAWDITTGRTNVVVAIIDSGIGSNPDLDPNVVSGIDLISDASRAGDGDGRDDDPFDEFGDRDPRSGGSSWHGTHVAGTVAAVSNNSKGVTGVASGVRVLPVRALGKSGGTDFDIAAGITWASGGAVPGVRANSTAAQVLNLSLGGRTPPRQTYQTVIDAAVARGAVVVVAAGNDDADTREASPCNQARVICVAATDARGMATQYSNVGAEVAVAAPGGALERDDNGDGEPDGVLSTVGRGRYAWLQGTSMATPHVSGVVALMKSLRPSLTYAEARSALAAASSPVSNCRTACGAGLVNAWKALRQVSSGGGQPGQLSLSATTLVLTPAVPTMSVTLTNTGSSVAEVRLVGTTAEASNVTWAASVVPLPLGPGASEAITLGYRNRIERDLDLPMEFRSATSSVGFTLRLRTQRRGPRTVVLLVTRDERQDKWVAPGRAEADPEGTYSLSGPPGDYFIVAASDDDGDGEFEEDEGFGIWPSLDSPTLQVIEAGKTYAPRDFSVAPMKE